MPYSLDIYTKDISNHLDAISPNTILDVGAGMGKYAHLIRSVLGNRPIIDAIEPTAEYASKFKLHEMYRNVFIKDVMAFARQDLSHKYDLCIMGDVLEHLFLYEAIGVLDALLYKCKFIMVIWPTNLPQDNEFDNAYEMHKSNFTIADLTRFNIQCYKTTFVEELNGVPTCANYVLISGHTVRPDQYMRRAHIVDKIQDGVINDV